MEVEISIAKTDVMPDVYRITGYTGTKAKDIDQVSSTEDDSDLLDGYFAEAATSLAETVSREGYLDSDLSTNATYTFVLPANWKNTMRAALEKAIRQYLVNHVCMQWFNLARKEETAYYTAMCADLAQSIRKYLLERGKPTRTPATTATGTTTNDTTDN